MERPSWKSFPRCFRDFLCRRFLPFWKSSGFFDSWIYPDFSRFNIHPASVRPYPRRKVLAFNCNCGGLGVYLCLFFGYSGRRNMATCFGYYLPCCQRYVFGHYLWATGLGFLAVAWILLAHCFDIPRYLDFV